MNTVGRFAPSPSGRMHLGNLLCALLAWLSVRHQGGRYILRIEDLDTDRCKPAYARQLEEDLRWLGLDWDEGGSLGGPHAPYDQSRRTALYDAALAELERQGVVYPCFCTRAQLHAASAPHREDGLTVYPGTCRNLTAEEITARTAAAKRPPALRLRVPEETLSFTDGHMGPVREYLPTDCGDFLLRRSDGLYAAGPDAAGLLSLPPAAGQRRPPPVQAGRLPGTGDPAKPVRPGGDRGKAGVSGGPESRRRTQDAPGAGGGLPLGPCATRGHPSAGGSVLTIDL